MAEQISHQYTGLRPTQSALKLGIGLSTLWYRAKRDPNFPQPRKIGPNTTVFIEHELDAYLAKGMQKAGAQ